MSIPTVLKKLKIKRIKKNNNTGFSNKLILKFLKKEKIKYLDISYFTFFKRYKTSFGEFISFKNNGLITLQNTKLDIKSFRIFYNSPFFLGFSVISERGIKRRVRDGLLLSDKT